MKQRPLNHKFWLAGAILAAIVLRFWNLSKFGLHHDAALNSARALGWFDFLVGVGQTAPILWFGYIPGWANLSFHDHPPLSFLLQKISFFLFGDSSFAALLPFAAAGALTTWVIFKLVNEHSQALSGLWAAAIFGVSSYAVWSARSGYLEGLLVFWISLSVYFFVRFITQHRNRDLYFWLIATACALLTKYTAVFLLLAAGLYFLFRERRVFSNRHFWLAVLVFLTLLSPVIIYNAKVYSARGHFDAALSSMVGMNPDDYSTLAYRSLGANPWSNLMNIVFSVKSNSSLLLSLLLGLSVIYFLWQTLKRRASPLVQIVLLNILTLAIMLVFAGAADRFVSIIMLFLAISAGLLIGELSQKVFSRRYIFRMISALTAIVLAAEFAFSLNTNVFINPVGRAPLAYSASRFNVDGFETLDEYLRAKAYGSFGPVKRINRLSDQSSSFNFKGREIVLFDERADWFSRVWYVDRYTHYYSKPIIYFTDLDNAIAQSADPQTDFLSFLRRGGATGFWIVIASPSAVSAGSDPDYSHTMQSLDAQLSQAGTLAKEISNSRGQTVFRVFHVQ